MAFPFFDEPTLTTLRNSILIVGWPLIVAGSVYLLIKGQSVYRMVRGSLIGKVTRALVVTMLVEMFGLGGISTAYMFIDLRGVYLAIPVIFVFLVFVWSVNTLLSASQEASKITG